MPDNRDTRESPNMCKIFLGGLNRNPTRKMFSEYFSQYGEVLDTHIVRNPKTGKSKGFAFITYGSSASVESVLISGPHIVANKTIDVKRAMPIEDNLSSAHARTKRLFVRGISPDLTPKELLQYIESRHPTRIGTIDKIEFLKDKNSNKKEVFGVLECSSADFVDRLTISEETFTLKERKMKVEKAIKEGKGNLGKDSRILHAPVKEKWIREDSRKASKKDCQTLSNYMIFDSSEKFEDDIPAKCDICEIDSFADGHALYRHYTGQEHLSKLHTLMHIYASSTSKQHRCFADIQLRCRDCEIQFESKVKFINDAEAMKHFDNMSHSRRYIGISFVLK